MPPPSGSVPEALKVTGAYCWVGFGEMPVIDAVGLLRVVDRDSGGIKKWLSAVIGFNSITAIMSMSTEPVMILALCGLATPR